MKTGTKELIKRVGAIDGFTGETYLFFLVPEDVSSEHSTEKGIKPRFPLAIAVYVLEKDPRSKSTREAPLLLKESS